MKLYTILAIAVLALGLFLAMVTAPARSQGRIRPPRLDAAKLDKMLQWQDHVILNHFMQFYPQDFRYRDTLARASVRLNPHLAEVYGHHLGEEPVQYFVFVSRIGFNAQTWNRLIIFDSLLLDALRNLSRGIALYGGTRNAYVQSLANAVSAVIVATHNGRAFPDFSNPDNPYNLPAIWGLPPEARDRADALFEEMVASWMAHEASHAYLGHTRERVETARLMDYYRRQVVTPDALRRYMTTYLSYSLGVEKELAADRCGVQLITRAGYGVEGFVDTLDFAELLEDLTGESSVTIRTHPYPRDRIRQALAVAAATRQTTPAP